MEVKRKIQEKRIKKRQRYIRLSITSLAILLIFLIGSLTYGYIKGKMTDDKIDQQLNITDEQQLIRKKVFTLYDLEHNGVLSPTSEVESSVVRYHHVVNHYYSLLYQNADSVFKSHTFVISEDQLYRTLTYYIDNKMMKQAYEVTPWSLILPAKDELVAQILKQHQTIRLSSLFEGINIDKFDKKLLNLGYQLSYSNNLYMTEPQAVFKAAPENEVDEEGVFGYRIPAFLTTDKGTLLAVADQHKNDNSDSGDINAILKRSVDDGTTWLDNQILLDLYDRPGNSKKQKMSAFNIDSAMVQDPETKRIFIVYDMFPEMDGILDIKSNDWPYKEVNGEQRLILLDGNNVYTVDSQGSVYDAANAPTNYRVVVNPTEKNYHDKGDLYQNEVLVGNIYAKDSPLSVVKTSYIWYQYSDDDGQNWSAPIDMTAAVKPSWAAFYGVGPGTGIALQNGRLIFSSYATNTIGGLKASESTHTIYSDDHGETWQSSEAINDGRLYSGDVLFAETLNSVDAQNSEGQMIQLNNGRLQMFMRNKTANVQIGESQDNGTTWLDEIRETDIHEPGVQMSVLHINYGGQEYVLVSNPDGQRVDGSVGIAKVLEDNTLEWVGSMSIQEGTYAYSSIVQQKNDEYGNAMFGIIYEHSEPGENIFSIYYRKFNLDYLLNNDITQSQQLFLIDEMKLENDQYRIQLSNGAVIYY